MSPCPRCTGPIGDRAARSRTTTARNLTICSACGTAEAVRDARGLAPVPLNEWPVKAP
ncbi:hypothetical protein [Streptomyces sp. NPDC047525]|uniref:hypothetical protein n=1 Tax=Streptomyces sp. NPDC047525 TaxID=3155264 RepID=UPI0033C71023